MQDEKRLEHSQLLPQYEPVVDRRDKKRYALRVVLALTVLALWGCTLFTDVPQQLHSLVKHVKHHHSHHGHHGVPGHHRSDHRHRQGAGCGHNGKQASCPVQVDPIDKGPNFDPEADEAYRGIAAQRLQGAVQVPTVSYDDMGSPDDDPRFAPMKDLAEYLTKTFPLMYMLSLLITSFRADTSWQPLEAPGRDSRDVRPSVHLERLERVSQADRVHGSPRWCAHSRCPLQASVLTALTQSCP